MKTNIDANQEIINSINKRIEYIDKMNFGSINKSGFTDILGKIDNMLIRFSKEVSVTKQKLEHVEILAKVKLDIIQNGKFRQCPPEPDGTEIPFICKEDEERHRPLEELMTLYGYAWYIAQESLEQQLLSITKFEEFILKNNGVG